MAEYMAQDCSDVPEEYARLIQLFQHTNQAFPFEGNRIAVYTEGYTKLQSLLRELQKAKQHIHIEYYIFEDDAIGRLVRDVLIEKASQGVEVLSLIHIYSVHRGCAGIQFQSAHCLPEQTSLSRFSVR